MEPINYQAQLDDPLKSFAGGFQVARGMEQAKREDAAYEEEQRMKPILEQQARDRQQQIMSVWANPASTREDFKAVMPLMDTKQLDAWGKAFASKDDAAKRDELGFGITVGNALDAGDYGLASKMIKNRIDGLKNTGGNPQEIFTLEQALTDPHRAKLIIHAGTAAREGFMASAQGLGSLNAIAESKAKLPGEIAKNEVQIAKDKADMRLNAARYNLDVDKYELDAAKAAAELGAARSPKLGVDQIKEVLISGVGHSLLRLPSIVADTKKRDGGSSVPSAAFHCECLGLEPSRLPADPPTSLIRPRNTRRGW